MTGTNRRSPKDALTEWVIGQPDGRCQLKRTGPATVSALAPRGEEVSRCRGDKPFLLPVLPG